MELNEKWKLTTQNNAYLWEGNQISKQNRYPCLIVCYDAALQAAAALGTNCENATYDNRKQLVSLTLKIVTFNATKLRASLKYVS